MRSSTLNPTAPAKFDKELLAFSGVWHMDVRINIFSHLGLETLGRGGCRALHRQSQLKLSKGTAR